MSSSRNFFAAYGLDRLSGRRLDVAWLEARLTHPTTRIVPVWRSLSLLAPGDPPRPVLLEPRRFAESQWLRERAVLLGQARGVVYFALELAGEPEAVRELLPVGCDFHELREVGAVLDADDGALLAYARAIVHWHRRHRFCGDCGSPTRVHDGGHLRVCVDPDCAQKHFPRTDPAIIVLVAHGEPGGPGERCLLGRQPGWPHRLYSTIAGFVEPGESLEDAVVREVREETGVVVGATHYHSSQPWPFPSSIMLGFTTRAVTAAIVRHDEELQDARWFTRAAVADGLAAGTLRLPRRISIAFRLVEDWFDAGVLGPLAERPRE